MPFYAVVLRGHRVAVIRGEDMERATHNACHTVLTESMHDLTFRGRDLWDDHSKPTLAPAQDGEIGAWAKDLDEGMDDGLPPGDAQHHLALMVGYLPGLEMGRCAADRPLLS